MDPPGVRAAERRVLAAPGGAARAMGAAGLRTRAGPVGGLSLLARDAVVGALCAAGCAQSRAHRPRRLDGREGTTVDGGLSHRSRRSGS